MADTRRNELLPTAESPAPDDYFLLDGETAGIRKVLAGTFRDAANLSYDFGVPGSVARSPADKLNEVVSVKDFGAVGDGQADDLPAIQAAIGSLGDMGGCVHFPRGEFRVSSAVHVDKNYVTLLGQGYRSSVIRPHGGYEGPLVLLGSEELPWRWGISMRNMGVRGAQGSSGEGIRLRNCHQWLLDGIECRHCDSHGIYGHTGWVGTFINNKLWANTGDGFFADGNCHGISFHGNHIIANQGYGLRAGGRMSVMGNVFEKNASADVWANKSGIFIGANYFEGGRSAKLGPAILVTGSHITIEANGLGAHPIGIRVEGASKIKIARNDTSLSNSDHLFSDFQVIDVDEDSRDLVVEGQEGPISVHPKALSSATFIGNTVVDHFFPYGELAELDAVDPLPRGFTNPYGVATASLVPSFSDETASAVRLDVESPHGYIQATVAGLKSNAVYTLGALISSTNETTNSQVRFYGTASDNRLSGEKYFWSTNMKRGSYVVTTAFTATAEGTANVAIGSPYLGTFDIEWMALVEGVQSEATFPRRARRMPPRNVLTQGGEYFFLAVDGGGNLTATPI